MNPSFTTFFKFATTHDEGEDLIVEGYASTVARDDDGDSIPLAWIKEALPGYMKWANLRQMHQGIAAGVVEEARVDDKGLFIKARVVDADSKQKVRKGLLKGFSVGGQWLRDTAKKIIGMTLNEISLVDRPCNQECAFSFGKMSKDGNEFSIPLENYVLTIRKGVGTSPNDIADQGSIHGRAEATLRETIRVLYADSSFLRRPL